MSSKDQFKQISLGYLEGDMFGEFTINCRTPREVAHTLGFFNEEEYYRFVKNEIIPKGMNSFNFYDLGSGPDGIMAEKLMGHFSGAYPEMSVYGIDRTVKKPDIVVQADFNNMSEVVGEGTMHAGTAICSLGWYAESREELENQFVQLWKMMAPGAKLLAGLEVIGVILGNSEVRKPSSFRYKRDFFGMVTTGYDTFNVDLMKLLQKVGFEASIEWNLSFFETYPEAIPVIIKKPD